MLTVPNFDVVLDQFEHDLCVALSACNIWTLACERHYFMKKRELDRNRIEKSHLSKLRFEKLEEKS
jgi:hypothetical protein